MVEIKDPSIMAELISKHRLDNLNAFAGAVWGNAEAVLKRDDPTGVEFIDLMAYIRGFEFLFGSAIWHDKILVREEYRIALHELETNEAYSRGAYVIGQPGIGKTLFLAYILVARLGQQHTVAWQFTTGRPFYMLFTDTATIHSFDDMNSLDEYGPMWALSDANDQVRSPAGIFYGLPSIVRTIQTTSPREVRWKEWSKQAGAECYVMDIWSEQEIADLAKLLKLDVERMTFLAKKWGGVPRSLLRFLRLKLTDVEIEAMFRDDAGVAVQKCRVTISSTVQKNLVEEGPSKFYFCRPSKTDVGINRTLSRAFVPTRTLRRLLAEELQKQNNSVRLEFFRALSQTNETRQAASHIYESWFHSYLAAAESITCHWLQGLDDVSSLTGTTTVVSTTWGAVKVKEPPYYWIAPRDFPGIDSALILDQEIYAFQVTISPGHKSPIDGLEMLREHLPAKLKENLWRVVFVGDNDAAIGSVAKKWVGKLFFPTDKTTVPIGWSAVDPVVEGIPYIDSRDDLD